MAAPKKKKTEEIQEGTEPTSTTSAPASKNPYDLIKKYKSQLGGVPLSKSKFGEVPYWINTGDLGLNRIISGNIHQGIPAGRVVIFGGASQSGKSLIMSIAAGNGMNHPTHPVHLIFLIDSEGGSMKKMFEAMKCDMDRIRHILVATIEEAKIELLKAYEVIAKMQEECPDFRAMVIVDSIGALNDNKVYTDALVKGVIAADQGLRARAMNSMMRSLTIPALRTMTATLVANHIYADPSQQKPGKIHKQGGGGLAAYMARIILQCDIGSREKAEDSKTTPDQASFYTATELKFFTVKNSFGKPFFETRVYLNFSTGQCLKYYGLFDPALRFGLIKESGKVGYYNVPSWTDPAKNFRASELLKNEEVWATFIDKFNEMSRKDICYGEGVVEIVDEAEEAADELQPE